MKLSTVIISAALMSAAGVAAAAVTPTNPKDLTMGRWELNVAKSKFCNTPPKAGGRWIFDAGWGLLVFEQSGINAEGKPTSGRYVGRYDGDKWPDIATGPAKESMVWKQISPSRVEFAHYDKQDKMTSQYYRVVSADGQQMTQHGKFVGRDCEEDQVFDRIKE